jgi:hypothetical protein
MDRMDRMRAIEDFRFEISNLKSFTPYPVNPVHPC